MAQSNKKAEASQDVAVVGLSCRFAGKAENANSFWEMLCDGKSGHSETTRFNPKGFGDPGHRKLNQSATCEGHFLQQDVGAFDTGFFGITPEEATAMDPQQRLMLEVTYEAFENAGITTQQLAGSRTGCFMGSFTSDYREMIFRDLDSAPRYAVTGTGTSMLADRVSWFFDLRGPSVTLNTACSSSLVALHLARRSLQSRETDIAVVGGANLLLGPEMFTSFSNLNFLSRDGLSRSFDASGEGYGRGEGVAAIVLKRMDDALRDDDAIRAVVRATATNQDGRTKAITLPSLDAQVELIRSAYGEAGLEFCDTTYFEAHGTGTRRGDPVELEAISKTLCVDRPESSKLIVGSVKSNVGHTEATAGLAGVIKAVYMLEKGLVPATIHYSKPLPEFDVNSSKLMIPTETRPWPATDSSVRRISVNSFGFGGANAHAVLDDATSYLASSKVQGTRRNRDGALVNGNGSVKEKKTKLLTRELSFVFSGPNQQALERNLDAMVQHLQSNAPFPDSKSESKYLGDLSYTLSERRSEFKLKAVITAASASQLVSKIRERSFSTPAESSLSLHVLAGKNNKDEGDGAAYARRHLLTDLPANAWDHSRTYWAASRPIKEFLRRSHPPRSLIGAPQPSYGENEHIWRGYLRLSEEPWVRDHQVLGSIVYPAAGYIAMAVEAAREVFETAGARKISRYTLRDVQFHTAAVIKEDVPLELIIQLRPHRSATRTAAAASTTTTSSAAWLEFVISSCHNERNVRENCVGLLSVEHEAADDSPSALEQLQEENSILNEYERVRRECRIIQNPKDLYQELASVGLAYGTAFQQISSVSKSEGGGSSSCRVELYEPDDKCRDGLRASPGGEHLEPRPVIHPATLDCMIQTIFPALTGAKGQMKSTMVPTLLEQMSISAQIPSASSTSDRGTSSFHGFSTAAYCGGQMGRDMTSNLAMLDHDKSKPAVIATGLHWTAISQPAAAAQVKSDEEAGRSRRRMCSRLTWTPAMDLVSPAEQAQVIMQPASTTTSTPLLQRIGNLIQAETFSRTNLSVLELGNDVGLLSSLPQGLLASGVVKYTIACHDENVLQDVVRDSHQLSRHAQKISYRVLDPEQSCQAQGFQDGTFDIVILSAEPSAFWEGLSKLMTSRGKLCVLGRALNTLQDSRGRDMRKFLKAANLDIEFPCESDSAHAQTQGVDDLIVARRPDIHPTALGQQEDILILEGDHPLAAALSDALMSSDLETARGTSYIPIPRRFLRSTFQQHEHGKNIQVQGKTCIVTLDVGQPTFLVHASPKDFALFKDIIRSCSRIIWVTSLSSADDGNPLGSVVTGLARTLRNENPSLAFRSLQVPIGHGCSDDHLAEMISRLAASTTEDSEFRLEQGLLKVSRIMRDPEMNDSVVSMAAAKEGEGQGGVPQLRLSTLNRAGQAQKLAFPRQGTLDDIYFEADEASDGPLLDDDVEIQVKASGINFRDVLVMMGNVSDSLIGHEASGIVSRVGKNVTSFRQGDRVSTIGHGCHRSIYRSPAALAHKIPQEMTFEEASTIPLVYCTAYTALVEIARGKKGQTILIHAAAGGVGLAAVQIANHLGLEVFATVSSEPKRQLLIQNHSIKGDHIFNSRDTSFAKGVMRLTSGRGVDIVLNSLAGEQLRLSWYCLAPFGTFVEIGIRDITANGRLDMAPFAKDATFAAFEVINILHKDPQRMSGILEAVFGLLKRNSQAIKPVRPLLAKPLSQVGEALRLLQTGKHMGKVALVWDRDQIIPMALAKPRRPVLSENATYILVGGFGGLGRSIAGLLAQRGARHICILSRSGAPHSKDALDTVQRLQDQGVQVTSVACDVSDRKSLQRAIEACEMPIRGVIQGAMVLRDVSFDKMTHAQWQDALRPKLDGSWNLHELVAPNDGDLDFFIMLSSFMGVFGSRTQGNYAAAGAYQDALAHYRRRRGHKAVSLDLGLMRDVSDFSRREALSGPFKDWQAPFGLREADVHALLDHIIASETVSPQAAAATATPTPLPAQIITGFGTAEEADEAGIDRPYYLQDKRFALLHTNIVETHHQDEGNVTSLVGQAEESPEAAADKKEGGGAGHVLQQAKSLEEATDVILKSLVAKVARHLEREAADIDPEEPLYTYGVDSLVAIEIRNWIMNEFASDVALLDITSEEPVYDLATRIAVNSKFVSVDA